MEGLPLPNADDECCDSASARGVLARKLDGLNATTPLMGTAVLELLAAPPPPGADEAPLPSLLEPGLVLWLVDNMPVGGGISSDLPDADPEVLLGAALLL